MSARSRLLPWSGPNGQPAYLLAEKGPGSHLWRLADQMEVVLLRMGTEMVQHARAVAADRTADTGQLRYTVLRLAEALTDALRVAESRGMLLTGPYEDEEADRRRRTGDRCAAGEEEAAGRG
ncbi:hypothetical protein ACZ90_08580 [Streptomyces albus subsp. albus]|nr:hypothetical protein ACZ90_08580 [Streptomyces albus subsp. albus]